MLKKDLCSFNCCLLTNSNSTKKWQNWLWGWLWFVNKSLSFYLNNKKMSMLSRDIAESCPNLQISFMLIQFLKSNFEYPTQRPFLLLVFFFFWWIIDLHEENYTVKIPKDPSLKIDHIICTSNVNIEFEILN